MILWPTDMTLANVVFASHYIIIICCWVCVSLYRNGGECEKVCFYIITRPVVVVQCTPSSALLPIQNIPKFSAATATQRYVPSSCLVEMSPVFVPPSLEIVANCFYPFHSFINSRRQQLVACTPDSPNLTIHSHTHLFAEASRDERHGWWNVCLSLWEEEC